jgi:hypothetical protein
MVSPDIKEKMRQKYNNLHPLLFQRSCDYAETSGELFDILESIPEPPFVWNATKRRWEKLNDITVVNFSRD